MAFDIVSYLLAKKDLNAAMEEVPHLNEAGKVPTENLPSYVDDIVEGYLYNDAFYEDEEHTIEIEGEDGKIYVDLSTGFSYRYSGSLFVQIGGVDLELNVILPVGASVAELKSIKYGESYYDIKSQHVFESSWRTSGTVEQFCSDIVNDTTAKPGMLYLGKLMCSDLPAGLIQSEAMVDVISEDANGKALHITITSVDTAPYRWEYGRAKVNGNYVNTGGIAYQLLIDNNHKVSSDLIDDTNKTHKFVTAQDKIDWTSKYDKPNTGIPATDLEQEVQDKLAQMVSREEVGDIVADEVAEQLDDFYNKQEVDAMVDGIEELIPAEATAQNQLADKAYVLAHSGGSGAVNSISINGVEVPLDAEGNADLPAYPNKETLGVNALEDDVDDLKEEVSDLEGLIPAEATPQNQLADKAYVLAHSGGGGGDVNSISIDGTSVPLDQYGNADLPAYPTKVSLQLGNVDNTSDANKPVSTLQQIAIDAVGHTIRLEMNSETFVIVAKLYDANNHLISTSNEINLPLETMVVSGSYDSSTKEITLVLQDGTPITFSVAALVSGLQTEITSAHPLASDLVDDSNQNHKFVIESQITYWNNKQEAISDLASIRNGARKGASAVQDENYVHTDNNYTDLEQAKLANIEAYAEVNVVENIETAAGAHINEVGTPSVSVSTSGKTTTLTFNYLKGEQGIQGPAGADGQDGSDGQDGQDGITPHIGANGNWFIGDTDTNVHAQGPAGTNGQDGQDGQDGQNGITPHIDSTTGNWFIGDVDTNIHAQGPAGVDGQNGHDGVTPHIDSTTGNWFIGNTDTGIHAQGPQGNPGQNGQDGQDGLTTSVSVNGTTYTQVGGLITLPNYPSQVIVDQVYDATSTNAQSGTAVAQAINAAIFSALNSSY